MEDLVFDNTHEDFSVYFFQDLTGFLVPIWKEKPSTNIGDRSERKLWLIRNGVQPDTSLEIALGSSIKLLVYYALDAELYESVTVESGISSNEVFYKFYGAREDVTYIPEFSKDLVTWSDQGIALSEPNEIGLRTASLSLAEDPCFFRLRFVMN